MKFRRGAAVLALWLGVLMTVPPVQAAPADPVKKDDIYEQINLFTEVLSIIREHYVEEVDAKKLITGAAHGMVKTLDPFSQFMEPEVYKEMKTETEGSFGGLGIRIALREGSLIVITPLPGTPAYRLGVLPEDRIIKIDAEDTKDFSLFEAVKRLRGQPGTSVKITVAREGVKDPIEFNITREVIKIETVRSRMLEDGIGYIRLIEFSKNSGDDLLSALKTLGAQGMKSLVFDLRNNPGGLLPVAIDICKTFVGDDKLVVYTEGRTQRRQDFRADKQALYGALPMAVLVNKGSASASEIFAGCVQDHRRAIIIGSQTFGKASVQTVMPLQKAPDGYGLRLTTARYFTPKGRAIHGVGLTPDILVEVPREVEAKLMGQEEELYAKDKPAEPAVKKDRAEDVVLSRAKDILKAREIFNGSGTP